MNNSVNNETKYILVTGATGQLGADVCNELLKRGQHVMGIGSSDLDITDDEMVFNFFNSYKFSHVVHCAGYTKVDDAETNVELNYAINVHGTENIVSQCYKYNIPMTFISTDYVFGGEGDKPYKETDAPNPLCEYANAKYQAENIVKNLEKYYILRISWVFGKNGNNFVKTMLRLSETKKELKVVSDQVGSPTYTVDLSVLIADMIAEKKYGIYNATNEGFVSWADFAREIFKETNKDVNIIDVTTEEYNAKAHRPKNSRLDKTKLIEAGFHKLPPWQDALKRYLLEING